MINILDEVNNIYGKPTSAALKVNDNIFCSPYLVANAPKVLFCRIEDCAKVALQGKNPYTDKQLVLTTICLLLGTGLYVHAYIHHSIPVQGTVPAYTPGFGGRGCGRRHGHGYNAGHALPPFVSRVTFPPGGGFTAGNTFAPLPAGG